VLVLTRKVGQSLMIDDSIEITLIEVRGEQVRLGISAPLSVSVRRKELIGRQNGELDGSTDEQSEN
jgi:carbon storage regulator